MRVLSIGGEASCPAAYIRALDLAVERLEQTYVRIPGLTSLLPPMQTTRTLPSAMVCRPRPS
jgi:hypothetical protein